MDKVCRITNLANAQTLILMEGLLCQSSGLHGRKSTLSPSPLTSGYRAFNLGAASRHLDQLRDAPLMHITSEKDEKTRTQLAMYIITGSESALYRLKPDTWENAELDGSLVDGSLSTSYENTIDSTSFGLRPGEDVSYEFLLQLTLSSGS